MWDLKLGANYRDNELFFCVWAPLHETLDLEVLGHKKQSMRRDEYGYFHAHLSSCPENAHYYYCFADGRRHADPVSRSLPEGLTGPTQIISPDTYPWTDGDWQGIDFSEFIFYEAHVGAFTQEGTFAAAAKKVPYLKELGITCLEIMPIAHFPGRFNWGYDAGSLFAPYLGYGGVNGLKQLVDTCHQHGISVCLDVVYNHLGPEDNYLTEFGPYLSPTYHTPWGKGLNYDGPESDHVRRLMVSNALYWLKEYHIDVLRLDAIGGIFDFSAVSFLSQLKHEVEALSQQVGRPLYLVAESDRNDATAIKDEARGGISLHALWNDDFHHALHVLLTGEQDHYYQDFTGMEDLAKAVRQGFVYDNKYSQFRKRHHGNSSGDIGLEKFIVFGQNHDQVGNRPNSNRINTQIDKESYKVAAFLNLLTPSIPMLFMGQEYREEAPFHYFVDFKNEQLKQALYKAKKEEGALYTPNQQAFLDSKLSWEYNQEILELYRDLIALRKRHLPRGQITEGDGLHLFCDPERDSLSWEYETQDGSWVGVFCYFGNNALSKIPLPFESVKSKKIVYSTDPKVELKNNAINFLRNPSALFIL